MKVFGRTITLRDAGVFFTAIACIIVGIGALAQIAALLIRWIIFNFNLWF